MIAPKATSSSNRSLMEHDIRGAKLWAVQVGHRTRYLVEANGSSWEFGLLWSALAKYDRICRKGSTQ